MPPRAWASECSAPQSEMFIASPANRLAQAIRERATQGHARFHLLVPSPGEHAEDGEHVLALALPLIDEAAGTEAGGSVSIRHDPMDAIEEALLSGEFDEIILSTLPRGVSRWLHIDLPSRVSHLGLPLTTVVAQEGAKVGPA